MPCLRSGICCRAIYLLDLPPEKISEIADKHYQDGYLNSDHLFVDVNWVPISEAEVLSVNPAALLKTSMLQQAGHKVSFYRCKQLDESTNLCKAHGVKPRVCSGYPYLDRGGMDPGDLIWPGCGYVEDILYERRQSIQSAIDSWME